MPKRKKNNRDKPDCSFLVRETGLTNPVLRPKNIKPSAQQAQNNPILRIGGVLRRLA
jgi:hypothetical protein